jgi:hypothetical protein
MREPIMRPDDAIETEGAVDMDLNREEAVRLAEEAYVYGYPLVYNVDEMVAVSTHPRIPPGSPVNLFGHATRLAGPEDEFVTLNVDTLYSFASCDVTGGPLVLHVPDTHDRYYVMQFIDAWSNNFAYVGRRSTGTSEGSYLLAGPGWDGEVPEGLRLIRSPTDFFLVFGRFAVAGPDDVPAVEALQRETWVTPLGRYPSLPDTSGREMGDRNPAPWDEGVAEGLRFWEKLRSWMRLFPPPEGDREFVEALAPLGLLEEQSPYVSPDPALAYALAAGEEAGKEQVEKISGGSHVTPVNGWISAIHSFDYNLDHLELGTIDEPGWKIADRRESYAHRAGAARGGLWGNHGYEAVYETVYVDDRGEQLNGDRRYVLHLDKTPPVGAFWSLTMYDTPNYYLVDNPIDRYSIGDRTPGLAYNDDGSLDIRIQNGPPGSEEANWLPAPEGDFRPVMRMYQPGEEVLNGAYELPAIQRDDS